MARAYSNRFRINVTEFSLPSWVPPQGSFANISLNTMEAVKPAGWPTSGDTAGPFSNWSGAIYAPDFSGLGAYCVHGSGHLTVGTPVWAGVWCFDLDTRLWVGRNVPAAPLLERVPDDYNGFGESIVSGTEGHTYAPHTYDGLGYLSPANGGGANGSMLRVFFAGASLPGAKCIHKFDLSSPSAPPTRVVDDVGTGGSFASYPASAVDEARGGVWVLTAVGHGPLKFVRFSDWTVMNYPGIEYNEYGNHSLIYLPPPYDCLVGMGSSGSGGVDLGVYVCPIVGNVPQGFTKITPTGTPPADRRCGGQWSTLLNCIVSYESAGSFTVHKLTPPAGSLTAGTWVWTSETLTGVNGATPSRSSAIDNGAWGRFIEVPAARCFLWCDGVAAPVQAWRLTGM